MTTDRAVSSPASAAFFDVDGTITATHIAHYYAYFRCRRLSPWVARLWRSTFLLKCVYYWLLDRRDRSRLNVLFYRGYAGLPAREIRSMAPACYNDVVLPRRFGDAVRCIEEHRRAGHRIVLVTGSLDFTVQPLADDLRAHAMLAPALEEVDGRFTGALTGPALGNAEKARRVRAYAADSGLDLAASHAYGDSIADVPMLETVGHAHVVNPGRRLAAVAAARGWTVHRWRIDSTCQERTG